MLLVFQSRKKIKRRRSGTCFGAEKKPPSSLKVDRLPDKGTPVPRPEWELCKRMLRFCRPSPRAGRMEALGALGCLFTIFHISVCSLCTSSNSFFRGLQSEWASKLRSFVQRLQAANSRVKVDLKRFVSFPDVQKKSPKKKSAAGKKGDESGEASAFPDLLALLRQRTLQRSKDSKRAPTQPCTR